MDHKRCTKLSMERNHRRVVQSSMDMLQTWRGNCDIQVLIYDCDIKNPNIAEIARVTDYVVAYSCKGNVTHREERKQNIALIKRADDSHGDITDVVKVSRQVLHDATVKRMISKQEAMVLLGNLDLVLCSETVENVSISSSKRLRKTEDIDTDKSFLTKYENRPILSENKNLMDYYDEIKNKNGGEKKKIPNFVGVYGKPVYPVTESYARHVLLVFRPWRTYPRDLPWVKEFDTFINSPDVPIAAYLPYSRVFQRYTANTTHIEPVSEKTHESKHGLNGDDADLLDLVGLKGSENTDYDTTLMKNLDKGLNYNWNKPVKVRVI